MSDREGDRSLQEYLDAVAAGTAAPGGGSVAGIVGALAAALGEMVANLTVGREQFAETEAELIPAQHRLATLREEAIVAASEDERAYAAYRAAAALPRQSPEQKRARSAAMHEALIGATEVPLRVARAAAETAEILVLIARIGNPHVRTDAALGALLAEAALRGALLNVRGNAALLRDRALTDRFTEEAGLLETRGRIAADLAFRVATAPTER